MKKSLLLASILGTVGAANAQNPTIVNGSFETWTNIPVLSIPGGLERPDNWYGSDQIVNQTVGPLFMLQGLDFDANKQLSKDENAHDGSFAAKLVSKDFGDTLKVMPVLMTNAKQSLNLAAVAGGLDNLDLTSLFTFTEQTPGLGKRIDSVSAYVSAPTSNVDEAAAFVMAYRKESADSMTLIGQGSISIAATTGFERVTIPVNYLANLSDAVDSVVIGFTSSGAPTAAGYHDGNTLYVDKVEMYSSEPTTTGLNRVKAADLGFVVYPNPATNIVNFDQKAITNGTLLIQNAIGQVMHQQKVNKTNTAIDISRYAAGTYFYEIYNEQGTARQTGKFVK